MFNLERQNIDGVMMKRCLIFANGLLPDKEAARKLLAPGDVLIAADGGTRHILSLGMLPGIVIGDLDSLAKEDQQTLENAGTSFITHPRDKDETDLELALRYALDQAYDPIVIVAALGGRLDQTMGNLSLLTESNLVDMDIRLDDGIEEVFFTRGCTTIQGSPGDTVSLLPWGGLVQGVSTIGLKWPLATEDLFPAKARGISNEMLSDTAVIEIKSGLLLITHTRGSRI